MCGPSWRAQRLQVFLLRVLMSPPPAAPMYWHLMSRSQVWEADSSPSFTRDRCTVVDFVGGRAGEPVFSTGADQRQLLIMTQILLSLTMVACLPCLHPHHHLHRRQDNLPNPQVLPL